MPLELREHYELVFASAVNQQKTDILRLNSVPEKQYYASRPQHPFARRGFAVVGQRPWHASEDSRVLLRTAVDNISDTANALSIDETRGPAQKIAHEQPVSLSCLVEEAVSKKRVEYRGRTDLSISTTGDAYGLFVKHPKLSCAAFYPI